MLSIATFRLAAGTDAEAFVASDARYQCDVAYQQPGLLRRTTAHADDGGWLVVTLWSSADHEANACEAGRADAAALAHRTLIDRSTLQRGSFTTLD